MWRRSFGLCGTLGTMSSRVSLGRAERSLVQELRDSRNKWAHQEPFSSDDADRALDSIASAPDCHLGA